MNNNDVIILDKFLESDRAEKHPATQESEHFELFCADQILKDYEISNEELKAGVVGSSDDGGIDAMYVFLNRDLVHEDTQVTGYKRGVLIELFFIQAKTSPSFSESAIDKFQASTQDLLDLSQDLKKLRKIYNHDVLAATRRFREAYRELVTRVPTLSIKYYYASKGDEPHPKVQRKAGILKDKVRSLLSDASVDVVFLGAKRLLELARRQPSISHKLQIAEAPIASRDSAFVCLASLDAYREFISDDQGNLRRNIFEANVRDYQGTNEVNDAIAKTLEEKDHVEDFFWLNNGVTILCTKATHSSKTLTIENPEIVNGLQTSRELQTFFSTPRPDDVRNILVRVIQPSSPESRDRIIKATNSQTTIPTASLRSTEKIHRDIEDFFRSRGLFYDRRKNFYKNEGKPAEKIISIPYLAQSIMAIALQRPDSARARPSSLLKKDEEYRKVFSEQHPIQLYEKTVEIMRRVDTFLRSNSILEREHQANLRYYIGLDVVVLVIGHSKPSMDAIAELDVATKITDERIATSVIRLKAIYDKLGASDQVAKGAILLSQWQSVVQGRVVLKRAPTRK